MKQQADVFDKYNIVVYDGEDLTDNDYRQCHAKKGVTNFEFKKIEFLANTDIKHFEKLANEFDWDVVDYYIGVGDLEKANQFFNLFGIYFRDLNFS